MGKDTCCSGYKYPPKFWFTWKFQSVPWILWLIILGHLLLRWWFQAHLLELKSFLCSHLYATCVIFGHRVCCFSCKGNVVFLQWNCVCMSGCHHIDIFLTHFTHFCHEGCCIKKSMYYAFWMVHVVSLSVHVRSKLSRITIYICVTNLTLSHFLNNLTSSSFLELFTFLLQKLGFLPCLLKPHIP